MGRPPRPLNWAKPAEKKSSDDSPDMFSGFLAQDIRALR